MRTAPVMLGACAVLMCGCATRSSTSTPLILEKEEGERRVVRGQFEDAGAMLRLHLNGGFHGSYSHAATSCPTGKCSGFRA
jgi:hypothetical protein